MHAVLSGWRRELNGADAGSSLSAMIRGRLRRHGHHEPAAEPRDEYIEIDPGELSGIFSVPQWLRDVGLMAWLLRRRRRCWSSGWSGSSG